MAIRHVVRLEPQEREQLLLLVSKGRGAASKLTHARILLKADRSDASGGWLDEQIAKALDVGTATVERVRKQFVEEGLEAALVRRKHKNHRSRLLDGQGEARLVALTCGPAPEGCASWTMQLLADRLVELKIVQDISDETVRRTLKKKSAQAVAKPAVVHSSQSQRRVRVRHGGRA